MKRIIISLIYLFIINSLFCLEENTTNKYVIRMDEGSPIYAIDDGEFITAGYDLNQGTYVEVFYKNLGLKVKYCNLSKIMHFANGKISKGGKIGESGFTGYIDKPCLSLIITMQNTFYMQSNETSSNLDYSEQ